MIHLISLGKLKNSAFEKLEKDFLKRLKKEYVIRIYELKTHEEDLEKESIEVLGQLQKLEAKYPQIHHVLLTEKGQEFTSLEFSKWISEKFENHGHLSFIIGGASGHGRDVVIKVKETLSLSKMTFPHKFSRLFFMEQVYRAMTLKEGHPYHK